MTSQSSGWQPIEHAPKIIVTRRGVHSYGVRLLLYPYHGEQVIGRWWQSESGESNWLTDGGNACMPTHFQFLPVNP